MNVVRRLVTSLALAAIVAAACTGTPENKGPVKLVILTHWGDQTLVDALRPVFDEYEKQTPNVKIEHQNVAFDELLKRITTGRLGGSAPDIYHFYNLWMPDFVGSDLLQAPPADVVADIKKGYSQSSVDGSSYRNQVWGYPTEVNTYQLIYNKKLLQEAGVAKPPATWDELRSAATKATKKGADGKVTQAGFLLLKGWDSGVVHPWSSLLWSNNGDYVAKDNSKVRFNEKPGIDTTQLEVDLIKSGAADLGFVMDDFPAGKVAMTIMANWWGAALKKALADNVGVAPIPTNGGAQSSTLQYNWLWGVDKNSKQAQESWKFLTWLNGPQGSGSSRMGKYLTTSLNAIPARVSDQQANASLLGDAFVKPFVDSLKTSRSEPIIPGAQEIKTVLQKQIEAAWFGQKSVKDALDAAATEANRILSEKK
jgi:multiple sugar transport system substrate-binding protein